MITENFVVDRVAKFLEASGFTIEHRRETSQKGVDITGKVPDRSRGFAIEAKGATSTKPRSKNFGKPFSARSVYTSVTTAYFCASTYVPKGYAAGIALPETDLYLNQVRGIVPALRDLKIEVFWVREDETVRTQGHWPYWP